MVKMKIKNIRFKNEDDLDAGCCVIWKGKEYITRNRYHTQVELYSNSSFVRTVPIQEIYQRVSNNKNTKIKRYVE